MDVPNAAWIRDRSNISFDEYGYPAPPVTDPPTPDRLQYKVDESNAELISLLATEGMALDWEDVEQDSTLAILLANVLRMLTEYNVARSQQEIVETTVDFDLVQSMSIGPISETRRSISSLANILHPHPGINRALRGILVLDLGGDVTLRDPGVPTVGIVDPMKPKPGADIMDRAADPTRSIFGELRSPGVHRVWDP